MFTISELQFLTETELSNETIITNVSIDGRNIKPNGLYIPIKGDKFNGHDFLQQAIEKGAIASLWEEHYTLPREMPHDFQLIPVKSTVQSLQELSIFYKRKINPITIAITGSNGKTTTKDILFSLLSDKYITHKTSGNLNNHLGVPLTLLQMQKDTEMAVIEMGMSGLGEIQRLSDIVEPDYAIITNIGDSHLMQLGNRENIARAKKEITSGLKERTNIYYDGDEPLLAELEGHPIRIGKQIENIVQTEATTQFQYENATFELPLLGYHHAKNASYAIAVAKELGVSEESIIKSLMHTRFTGMRMEKSIGQNHSILFNDSYNASPVSMKGAIKTIANLPHFNKKILVLGDMLELGPEEETLHRSIANCIDSSITHLFCIGERAHWIFDEAQKVCPELTVYHTLDKEMAITNLLSIVDEKTVVITKASRGMKLDTIIQALEVST